MAVHAGRRRRTPACAVYARGNTGSRSSVASMQRVAIRSRLFRHIAGVSNFGENQCQTEKVTAIVATGPTTKKKIGGTLLCQAGNTNNLALSESFLASLIAVATPSVLRLSPVRASD